MFGGAGFLPSTVSTQPENLTAGELKQNHRPKYQKIIIPGGGSSTVCVRIRFGGSNHPIMPSKGKDNFNHQKMVSGCCGESHMERKHIESKCGFEHLPEDT